MSVDLSSKGAALTYTQIIAIAMLVGILLPILFTHISIEVLLLAFIFILLGWYGVRAVIDTKKAIPPIIALSFFTYIEPSPTDILAIIAIGAFFFSILLGKLSIRKFTFADVVLILYLGVSLCAVLFIGCSPWRIVFLGITVYLVLFYFLITVTADSSQQIEKYLKWYVVAAFITSLAAVLSGLGFAGSAFNWMGSILNSVHSRLSEVLHLSPRSWHALGDRATGFFKDPNTAAFFIVPAVVFMLCQIVHRKGGLWYRAPVIAICLFGVILTVSGSGFVMLAVGVIVALFLSSTINMEKFGKVIILVVFISISIYAAYTYTGQGGRLANKFTDAQQDRDVINRIERYKIGINAISERPFLGCNLEPKKTPHDSYLSRFAMSGFIAFAAFLAFLIYILFNLWELIQEHPTGTRRIIAFTLFSSMFAAIPAGMSGDFIHKRSFWLLAGLSVALIRIKRERSNVIKYVGEKNACNKCL